MNEFALTQLKLGDAGDYEHLEIKDTKRNQRRLADILMVSVISKYFIYGIFM